VSRRALPPGWCLPVRIGTGARRFRIRLGGHDVVGGCGIGRFGKAGAEAAGHEFGHVVAHAHDRVAVGAAVVAPVMAVAMTLAALVPAFVAGGALWPAVDLLGCGAGLGARFGGGDGRALLAVVAAAATLAAAV